MKACAVEHELTDADHRHRISGGPTALVAACAVVCVEDRLEDAEHRFDHSEQSTLRCLPRGWRFAAVKHADRASANRRPSAALAGPVQGGAAPVKFVPTIHGV